MFAKWTEADGRFLFQEFDNGGVHITSEEYFSLMNAQATGKIIKPGNNGAPTASDPLPIPFEYFAVPYMADVRLMRSKILDRLSGIAGRASRSGNDALAITADELAESLLRITEDQTVVAAMQAKDYVALHAAVKSAYKYLASSAPAELQTAFNEVDA